MGGPPPAGPQPAPGGPGPAAAGPGPASGPEPDGQPQPPGAPAAPHADPSAPPDDRIGPGDDATAATGRLGHGSQRYGHLRAAYANVDGDVVGRDKNVFLFGEGPERLWPLSPVLAERVRFAYEEAPGADEARDALRRQRIVILRGPAGIGKTAMAARLLIGVCRGPVYHLDSGAGLGSLADRLDAAGGGSGGGSGSGSGDTGSGIEPGAGFLLDRPADAANLRGEIHDRLQTALMAAGATMVVTVADTDLADSDLLSGVVDLTRPPAPRALVRRYLTWRLGAQEAAALLADPEVEKLLAERVDGRTSCKAAADLATAMADEYQYGGLDAGRIRERLARQGLETFEIWAEGLTDPFVRAFALALAVLNGLPQDDIAAAARALLRRMDAGLSPAEPAPGEPRYQSVAPRDLLALPMRKLLVRLHARRVAGRNGGTGSGAGQGGPGDGVGAGRTRGTAVTARPAGVGGPGTRSQGQDRTQCLEYQDPAYPRQVIAHFWSQYAIQDVLLDWFGDLVRERSEQVRVYAAVALGGLLRTSLPYLTEGLLSDWAFHQDFRLREAAGYALATGGRDPGLRPEIEALTDSWFADRTRPLGQATAARVYGLGRPAAGHGRNIAALARLSVVDHMKVAVAIGDSYSDMIAADHALAPLVLSVLRSGAGDPPARPTCLLAFLIVASSLVVDGTRPDMADGDGWPALLYLTADQPGLREPLLVLWREALSQAYFNKQAQGVLRTWAGLAEADDKLRETFMAMVAGIVHGDQRSAAIVRMCARDWTGRDELAPLPVVAWEVGKVLEREKV
ncbi:hypothetical protein [Streptomyces sp. HPF1205]|uniref:hypothetical protein n=1 Tax=Streptomyces sp. HPF1205 TaxID=2873262 RepID=UPI001CEC49B1|nr:hypothetical protein [Streptomyces sp. HPF1205]